MFGDTTYTAKSGKLGTSMFSKPGRRTTCQYLCFDDKKPPIILPGEVSLTKQAKGQSTKASKSVVNTGYIMRLQQQGVPENVMFRAKQKADKEMREEKTRQNNTLKKEKPPTPQNERFVINEFEMQNMIDVKKSFDAFGNPILQHSFDVTKSQNFSTYGARSSFLALPRDKQINHVVINIEDLLDLDYSLKFQWKESICS